MNPSHSGNHCAYPPSVGISGAAICPHYPPFTPGRPWLSRGTKHRKAAFSSADDRPYGGFCSRPPCQFPFLRPRGHRDHLLPPPGLPEPLTLEGYALPLQPWGLEQGGTWGAHTVWRSCWFPALCLPMRRNRPLKEGRAASMAPQGRMVGRRVQGFQAPLPADSPNHSLALPSQRQLNWKFPLSPGPPVLYEGHGIRGAG